MAVVLVHLFDSDAGGFCLYIYLDENSDSCIHILFIFISYNFYAKSKSKPKNLMALIQVRIP